MNELEERKKQCPYCGESIDILIDCSETHQNYIEDCPVCCQPITVDVTVSHEGEIAIVLFQENES
ncbi:hypothetical protein AU255_13865 [Methyloprofundus sedimenti]|uniref:CPXCG motif-containing cysteine-rich protein n=1 Tax=Methyloprofundus sedimenti TaxID=1420851 RepID=A0A1V8M460_9GAMM|nr:CPXCG motif-containing cysteine-rich protein [Methyloprofundus sedimenti]OQK16183.1 hypothetical protein AU255_13865 [Methyloprofundus sedimenti]